MGKYKYIMGIQSYASHDSGACILRCSDDGGIVDYMTISEERLIRVKYPYVFPVHSIGYCMDYFGLTDISQIDLLMTEYVRIKRWFNSSPSYNISDYDYLKMKFDIHPKKIRIISHHMAHAASTYYASGFGEAAILIVDGVGSDLETTSYFYGKEHRIQMLENYKYYGIGACYNAVSKHILGFGPGGEGKTMGLAPYGEKYPQVLSIESDLDGIKNNFSRFMSRLPYSDILNQIEPKNMPIPIKHHYKRCENKEDLLDPYFARAAYDVQKEAERVILHLAKDLQKKTGSHNLCIAGGVGLNSVANKIILDEAGFENVFIYPACSDAGIPFGLATWGYNNCREIGEFKRKSLDFKNVFTGIEYSEEYIINVLKKYNIPYEYTDLAKVARLVAESKIVGLFQGGSEYGPRALGHRSIIADSRDKNIKDILNSRVKHREGFRPFAPAILREHCSEYFELNCESPYMLLIANVKKPEAIPAVTHVDNTARVQTVRREDDPIFYDLIKEYYRITGVPCILNTSFNEAGEPIVETPEDAIICFLKNEIEYLVLENMIVDSNKIRDKKNVFESMLTDRNERIKERRKELIERCFKGYNEVERDYFISESNKMSEWHAKYRSKFELEKKVLEWVENRQKILIVGTRDHTENLKKYINNFSLVDVVGFCSYGNCFDKYEIKSSGYREYDIKEMKNVKCDEILISSFEYNFKIRDALRGMGVEKPMCTIYDNASRNFMDVFGKFPSFMF